MSCDNHRTAGPFIERIAAAFSVKEKINLIHIHERKPSDVEHESPFVIKDIYRDLLFLRGSTWQNNGEIIESWLTGIRTISTLLLLRNMVYLLSWKEEGKQ